MDSFGHVQCIWNTQNKAPVTEMVTPNQIITMLPNWVNLRQLLRIPLYLDKFRKYK